MSNEVVEKAHELTYKSKTLLHLCRKFKEVAFSTTPIIQSCSCGRKYSPVEWNKLPLLDYQTIGHLDAEHRNCPCGSTLTLIIERRKPNDARKRVRHRATS
jgi:hypothetical protein